MSVPPGDGAGDRAPVPDQTSRVLAAWEHHGSEWAREIREAIAAADVARVGQLTGYDGLIEEPSDVQARVIAQAAREAGVDSPGVNPSED